MARLFAKDTIGPKQSVSADYQEQLRKEHNGSKWGSTGYRYSGAMVRSLIENRKYLRTALDYGCGKGTLAAAFDSLEWSEYDPGIPGKDVKPNGTFDLVTCTDVLEHVEPNKLAKVLDDLANATGKVLFLDIACYETGKTFGEGPYKGKDLHLIVESPEWWLKNTGGLGLHLAEFHAIRKYTKGKYKDRAVLVYERI